MKLLNYLNDSTRNDDKCHVLTDEEVKRLKRCLLSIYKDIARVCEKYGLICMLGGGSALGAVRHKGFIPWDDDMDLMMPRKDYERFISLFDKELGDGYKIASPYSGNSNYFVQVIKKNTFVRSLNETEGGGVRIDIFPIDVAPRSVVSRYMRHYLSIACRGICFSAKAYRANDDDFKRVMQRKTMSSLMYWSIMMIGFTVSWIPVNYWCKLFDRIVSKRSVSEYSTIAHGRNLYMGELLKTNVFFPPSKGEFEGMEIFLPNYPDVYLRNLYGDNYMELPPVEKRETHGFFEFDIPDEY